MKPYQKLKWEIECIKNKIGAISSFRHLLRKIVFYILGLKIEREEFPSATKKGKKFVLDLIFVKDEYVDSTKRTKYNIFWENIYPKPSKTNNKIQDKTRENWKNKHNIESNDLENVEKRKVTKLGDIYGKK